MRKLFLSRMQLTITLLVGISLSAGVSAFAQDLFAPEGKTIYSGQAAADVGIKLGCWGAGIAEESSRNTYGGSRAIRVTPKDLYAGGRIDFNSPVDLAEPFGQADAYLQLITRFGGAQEVYDQWAMQFGAPSMTDMYGGAAKAGKSITRLQIMLCFEGGRMIESQVDLSGFKLSEDGWMVVSFPFATLKGNLNLPTYKLTRMVISGNGTEPFNIGEIRILRDKNPLETNAGQEKEVARNYNVVFQGTCIAGATAVKYSWDFDAGDGIQEEAVGDLINHVFRRAGNFVVTLTCSDVFGIKRPASAKVKVKVNE